MLVYHGTNADIAEYLDQQLCFRTQRSLTHLKKSQYAN